MNTTLHVRQIIYSAVKSHFYQPRCDAPRTTPRDERTIYTNLVDYNKLERSEMPRLRLLALAVVKLEIIVYNMGLF